jgi:hypothetical protein
MPPRGRFPGKPLNITQTRRNHTLAFPSAVYWMELDRQGVRRIFTAPPDDPVISASDFDPPDARNCAIILTTHRLHMIDPSDRRRLAVSAPLELDHDRFSGVSVARLPHNGHYFASAWWEGDGPQTSPHFEFAADGTLLRRLQQAVAVELDLVNPFLGTR